jgi:hypothetical protein
MRRGSGGRNLQHVTWCDMTANNLPHDVEAAVWKAIQFSMSSALIPLVCAMR